MNVTRSLLLVLGLLSGTKLAFAQGFESEPNDTLAQATPLPFGVFLSGQAITRTDVDHFSVSASQAGGLLIDLRAGSDNLANYVVTLLNSAGVVQASYSRVYAAATFSQSVSIPTAGTYYIRLAIDTNTSFSNTDRQYFLTATFSPLVPLITEQPTGQNAIVGTTATFRVSAMGLPPISYQWRKDGIALPGQTSPSLRIASVTTADSGAYSVAVSNSAGPVLSSAAVLNVIPLPAPPPTPRLINLSVLTALNLGEPLAVGFVIQGSQGKRVLIRAVGPTLSIYGVSNPLSDPRITLFDQQRLAIGSNNDWLSSDAATMTAAGAFALQSFSRDSAMTAILQPGPYTVQVSGPANATGPVLVEVYEVP